MRVALFFGLIVLAGCETQPSPVSMACQSGDWQACAYQDEQRRANALAWSQAIQPTQFVTTPPPQQTWCRPDGTGGFRCS